MIGQINEMKLDVWTNRIHGMLLSSSNLMDQESPESALWNIPLEPRHPGDKDHSETFMLFSHISLLK